MTPPTGPALGGAGPTEDVAWPVCVRYTEDHVVWVEAATPAAAARQVQGYPWEYTGHDTQVDSFVAVTEPDDLSIDQVHTALHGPWRIGERHIYGVPDLGVSA